MSMARQSTAFDVLGQSGDSLFERERERLIDEISSGFEELMTHTNVLNRKLEEVFGVGKEFTTVAALWGKFNALIREQQNEAANQPELGVPGTGGSNFTTANR